MKLVTTPKVSKGSDRSKTYHKYEKLLADIEKQKQIRQNLQEGLKKAYLKIEQEILPLQHKADLLFRDYLIRLDKLAAEIGVGKYNQEYFKPYMANEIDLLLETFGHQDVTLSALYQKYADVTLEEILADSDIKEMVDAISKQFGIEMDMKEFLLKGKDEYFAAFKEKYAGQINDRFNDFTAPEENDEPKKPAKKKSDTQGAQIAKDARNIYMRLIKKYHPDLETDLTLKGEKTEIVKQVTKAYKENDFFTLLKLQIAYLEDNETEAAVIADDMLKQYNRLLKKQLEELDAAIHDTFLTHGMEIAEFIDKNGKFSPQKFAASKRRIDKDINYFTLSLKDSAKRPKGWFKDQLAVIKDSTMRDMMDDIFADIFSDF